MRLLLTLLAEIILAAGSSNSVRAGAPAEVDPGFRVQFGDPVAIRECYGLIVDATGRVTVSLLDAAPSLPGPNLIRYLPDGNLDSGFLPQIAGSSVNSMLVLRNGKMLVGGRLRVSGEGVIRTNLARLNPDGSLDPSFDPGLGWGSVGQLFELPDGKLLVGARRLGSDGVGLPGPHRLEADGQLDGSFAPHREWAELTVENFIPRKDGSSYLIGMVRSRATNDLVRIARALPDGAVDYAFHYSGPWVYSGGALSPDGGVFVFTQSLKSDLRTTVMDIVRLRPDGSPDPAFRAEVSGRNYVVGSDIMNPPHIFAMALQVDGRLLLAGKFDKVNGVVRRNVARLELDGAVDTSFDPGSGPALSPDGSGFGYPLKGMVMSPEGRVYLTGKFDRYAGDAYKVAVRLWGDPVPRLRIGHLSESMVVSWVGHPGESVEIEASSDLKEWSSYYAFTNRDGVVTLPLLSRESERVFLRARVK
jgi:uncharacterized delta-60 repeat protein